MSESQTPQSVNHQALDVSVDDVRQLIHASTPHFSLQLRNRIRRLIADLPAGHPARLEGEREIARLDALGHDGEIRGHQSEGLAPLASVSDPKRR
ncbi:MAG: hypothetical protein F2813_04875 [Actinobacteria bacterium]|uniref:Unannotated protein n=1 Tax=freshwater metagenome TaxID=449393 RepID=A0A6J5ZPY7_9ZZZZ|nr:hypothetical protein [Actinomycetota bacterium]